MESSYKEKSDIMMWDDIFSTITMKEGDIITYATQDGVYIEAEIVKVACPQCLEEFIGNKREAGGFLAGHLHYHEFILQQAEYYGGE
jgi:hypothetical protein